MPNARKHLAMADRKCKVCGKPVAEGRGAWVSIGDIVGLIHTACIQDVLYTQVTVSCMPKGER